MSRLRYFTLIAVVSSLLASLLMMYVGATKTVKAFGIYFWHQYPPSDLPDYLDTADQTMITLVESIDAFLVALVFFVLAMGIFRLFVSEEGVPKRRVWDSIRTLEELKKTLVEMIMVVLVVFFLGVALYEGEHLGWELLVIPASVVLLAVSVKLVGWAADKE